MADATGNDTPSTDPKSTGKSGPVRPPVLEGTARPAADAAPEPKTGSKPEPKTGSPPPASPPPRADDRPAGSGGAFILSALLGGAIGLGAAYALAWSGLWPAPVQAPTPADPRLAQFAAAIPELEQADTTIRNEFAALDTRLANLEARPAEPPASTPTEADAALAEDIAGLAARLDELAASSGSASQPTAGTGEAEAIRALEAELNEIRDRVAALDAAISASEAAGDGAARLPLVFSGLETAFATGRPYEAELAALRRAWPEAAIPEAIAGRAGMGLPRPDEVARALQAALPDMLAGRPAPADTDWQEAAADWFRGIVAMRPSGAVEGDAPDAIVARLETAVARRDFAAAAAELATLPEPMRAASGGAAGDIAVLADAQAFLADLRSRALAGGNGG